MVELQGSFKIFNFFRKVSISGLHTANSNGKKKTQIQISPIIFSFPDEFNFGKSTRECVDNYNHGL